MMVSVPPTADEGHLGTRVYHGRNPRLYHEAKCRKACYRWVGLPLHHTLDVAIKRVLVVTPGGLAFLCTIPWMFLMYDSPEQHPRIEHYELKLIAKGKGPETTSKVGTKSWGGGSVKTLSLIHI